MTAPVLVIGATGETGRRVVRELVARGVAVRAMYRSAHDFAESVEAVRGDVRDPSSLEAACRGVGTVISCLGNRRYFGSGGMLEVDVVGSRNLMASASASGVAHVIQLSAFGLDRRSPWLSLFSAALNRYFYHKQLVEDAVLASGIPFTLVRPHELRNRSPRGLPVLNQRRPLSLMRTVSRDTVACVLASCVDEPRVHHAIFELLEDGTESLDTQLAGLARDGRMHLDSPKTPLW